MWISPAELILPIRKAGGNPYHDQRGRFTTADDAGAGAKPDKVTQLAQYRAAAQGTSRGESGARAAAMPAGERYTGTEPMTDDQWAAHTDYVQRQLTAAGAEDGAHSPLSTHISEDYVAGAKGIYNDARRALQNQMLGVYAEKAQKVPNERRCIMTGGPGGAGKSTLLRLGARNPGSIADKLGIKYDEYNEKGDGVGDPSNFVIVNADDFKDMMAAKGMIPKIDHLSPMEGSTFVHEESSDLARTLGRQLADQGKNLIWDFTMTSPGAVLSRMKELHTEGYHTAALFVDVSPTQSRVNAEKRARGGQDRYNAGNGYGGRTIPKSHLNSLEAPSNSEFSTKNAMTFDQMRKAGVFDQWILVDNNNYAGRIVAEGGSNANGKEPMPPRLTDFNNRRLAVGDQVSHVDGSDGMIGTIESVPQKGDADHRLGVYWITPGKGAIRDKHMADKLVKTGGPLDVSRDTPDRVGGRTLLGGQPDHAVSPPAREMSWGEFRPYPAPTVESRQVTDDTAAGVADNQKGWAKEGKPRKGRSSGVNQSVDYAR